MSTVAFNYTQDRSAAGLCIAMCHGVCIAACYTTASSDVDEHVSLAAQAGLPRGSFNLLT